MARAHKPEKENMGEFIAKKREMFLVQMSLDTKREEIRKLEEKAAMKVCSPFHPERSLAWLPVRLRLRLSLSLSPPHICNPRGVLFAGGSPKEV